METYHKISTPFKRDMDGTITGQKGRLIIGDWARPEFEYLADNEWEFTEKVDGTNIRIEYTPNDGLDRSNVFFAGRTNRAIIPDPLLDALSIFTVERFHRAGFVEDGVTLFGEGYGPKIQGGGKYVQSIIEHNRTLPEDEEKEPEHKFVLFDVKIGDFWLDRDNVIDIANKLNIEYVPILGRGTLWDAIEMVKGTIRVQRSDFGSYEIGRTHTPMRSQWGDFEAEGIVARPTVPLFNRKGERIVTKIKAVDFR